METEEKLENRTTKASDENTSDYSTLSHDELVAIIKKQQEQLDALLNPPPND